MKKNLKLGPFVAIILIPLLIFVTFVAVVDPFFHYHGPLPKVAYTLSEERYQNHGIVRNFDYEAMITGSSETQNFLASEFSALWGTNTVKTSFAGGTFKEVNDLVKVALKANPNCKYVLRSLDLNLLNSDKDALGYDSYPTYLYDKNPFNDYQYIFNKKVVLMAGMGILDGLRGGETTSFDQYSRFADGKEYGKEAVLRTYARSDLYEEKMQLWEEDYKRIESNVIQNIIDTARQYPDVTFYYFIPPYSVCYWDTNVRGNSLDYVMDEIEFALSLLVEVENVQVYAFCDRIDITGNLDNYIDTLHYSAEVNTFILESIKNGQHRMTRDNYEDYIEDLRKLYSDYDYEWIYE